MSGKGANAAAMASYGPWWWTIVPNGSTLPSASILSRSLLCKEGCCGAAVGLSFSFDGEGVKYGNWEYGSSDGDGGSAGKGETVTCADVDEGGLDVGEARMSSVDVVDELTEGRDTFPS